MSILAADGCDRVRRLNQTPLFLAVTLLSGLILAGCSGGDAASATGPGEGKGGRGGRKGGGAAVPVAVAISASRDVPVQIQVIGNVEAYASVSVKAQVSGQLAAVNFQEGDFVRKGDLLFSVDPRSFEAALNQALATNARDEAALGQVTANLARDTAQARYAESQAGRYAELFKSGIVARDQAEQLRAAADAANQAVAADKAAIESAKAAIAGSKAAIENARIQLGYTKITSPLAGRTGAVNVKQGNVVTANSMELATIHQVEPIYVTFAVPENQLAAVRKYMGQRKLAVQAQPQEAPDQVETGVLTFIDNAVDQSTGTIRLKATFPNKKHTLWPGQFVHVTLHLATQTNAIVVPTEAVQTGQDGTFVYVVKQDRTVESRPVVVGARVEEQIVLEQGLAAGETVVTEGHLRLAPGSHVVLKDGSRPAGGRRSES